MGPLGHLLRAVPDCPICEGPCRHEFERSPYVFPDRLPKAPPERNPLDPVEKPVKVNRRGRRAHRPDEDRAHTASEDR